MEVTIFCNVVDNFGDAGFCLRLGRGLSHFFQKVHVFCNNLEIIKRMTISANNNCTIPKNIFFYEYHDTKNKNIGSISLVIETFQSYPPIDFIEKIQQDGSASRVMLDHLSTEVWSGNLQGMLAPDYRLLNYPIAYDWKNSPAAKRRWHSPGFSKRSAGLILNGWSPIGRLKRENCRKYLLNSNHTHVKKNREKCENPFIICLFVYEMNIGLLFKHIPEGFDGLAIWRPPFITAGQIEFDDILQSSDLNLVRGEDSFFSAVMASAGPWKVPFFWQPYPERKGLHMKKFHGWKDLFPQDKPQFYWSLAEDIAKRDFDDFSKDWILFLENFRELASFFHVHCSKIANIKSLEKTLIDSINL